MGSEFGLGGADDKSFLGAVPSSFQTQMAMATGGLKFGGREQKGDDGMMARLMLARMKTLEEGFAAVVREVREMREESGGTAGNSSVGEEGVSTVTKGESGVDVGGKGKGRERGEKVGRKKVLGEKGVTDFAKFG